MSGGGRSRRPGFRRGLARVAGLTAVMGGLLLVAAFTSAIPRVTQASRHGLLITHPVARTALRNLPDHERRRQRGAGRRLIRRPRPHCGSQSGHQRPMEPLLRPGHPRQYPRPVDIAEDRHQGHAQRLQTGEVDSDGRADARADGDRWRGSQVIEKVSQAGCVRGDRADRPASRAGIPLAVVGDHAPILARSSRTGPHVDAVAPAG